MVGAEGFKLINFHLESCGMSVVLWFIVFLTWFWNVFVGFTADVRKLLLSRKFCIVLLNREYNYGVSFVVCCYHSIVIRKFCLY